MKFFFLSILILLSTNTFSQSKKTFSYSDSAFVKGQKHTMYLLYQLGRAGLDSLSMPTIDSLKNFLVSHPKIKLEIGGHSDSRAKPSRSIHLSYARAQSIKDSLVKKGIDEKRLSAKGYEGTQLLFTDEMIRKQKTKQAQEELHAKNRRTALTITSVE
jgi:outer membrane protein OmpA-like peptidoglycan-associated protein